MVFGFFKKKAAAPEPVDPLVTFEQVLVALHRQGTEVRRAAATLLALRGELTRDREKYRVRLGEVEDRRAKAVGQAAAEQTLARDAEDTMRLLQRTEESLAQVERDGQLLLETAERLGRQHAELEAERQSAKTRLTAGALVSETLRTQVASFDRVMKLDAARDEVERAHALAELYREETEPPR